MSPAPRVANSSDLPNAQRQLETAERSAKLWEGTAWEAATAEAKAHVAAAVDDVEDAQHQITVAAEGSRQRGNPSTPSGVPTPSRRLVTRRANGGITLGGTDRGERTAQRRPGEGSTATMSARRSPGRRHITTARSDHP